MELLRGQPPRHGVVRDARPPQRRRSLATCRRGRQHRRGPRPPRVLRARGRQRLHPRRQRAARLGRELAREDRGRACLERATRPRAPSTGRAVARAGERRPLRRAGVRRRRRRGRAHGLPPGRDPPAGGPRARTLAARSAGMSGPAMADLFEHHAELRAVIEAVVEGRLGRAALAGEPAQAARLSLGCYEVFGGDARHGGARRLVETVVPPRELVYGRDQAWRRLILDVHGSRVRDRPMRTFDATRLDRATLEKLVSTLPSAFELRRLDAALAAQLDAELEPHALQVFQDAESFAAQGIGYGAVAGGRLVCAATSYAIASRSLEVAIATRPAFRGRGLAAAVAARLLLHGLEAGLVPHWS